MADNVIVRVPEQQFIRGEDGYSPEVTIENIDHGHSVNITDREHPEGQTFNVLDGDSAYEQAVAGGYTGTEAQFNEELRSFKALSDETKEAAPFYAEYGVTTKAEIETAINGKRQIYVNSALGMDYAPLVGTFLYLPMFGNVPQTGYRFAAIEGTTQYIYDLRDEWSTSENDLTAPADRAETAAAQALIRMNSADASAQAAAGSAGDASTAATTATTKAGEASDSATAADGSAKDSEAYAIGKRGGTDVDSTDPAYHNNAKYYAEQASGSASDAATAKGAAETAQGLAESAQTAAETAQGKAEDAQEAAEAVLASIPSDYTTLSGDVDNLKSAVTLYTGNAEIEFVKDKYIDTSESTVDLSSPINSTTGYGYAVVDCAEGDNFTVTATGGQRPRAWCFIDAENNALTKSAASVSVINRVITAPANTAKLVINAKYETEKSYYGKILKNRVDDLESAKAPAIYNTASGAIASFDDGADGTPLKALTVDIEPVQDLHGYDYPWPDEGGKNKIPLTLTKLKARNTSGTWNGNEYTLSGLTFTVSANGDAVTAITADGTNATTNWISFYIPVTGLINGESYVLNGTPAGGSGSKYRGTLLNYGYDYGSSYSFTKNKDGNDTVSIDIAKGYTAQNVVFHPMIRLASVSNATFEPYSNICPISGWTSATIYRSGEDTSNPTTYPITFPSPDPGTVYGGTLDVVNKKLTVDKAGHIFTGTETFKTDITSGIGYITNPKAAHEGTGGSTTIPSLMCSHLNPSLSYLYHDRIDRTNRVFPWYTDVNLYLLLGYPTGVTSAEEYESYLQQQYAAGTPVTVCYPLDTPIVYDLTADEITTLLGTNNIWADAGSISVNYPADTKLYIQKINAPTDDGMTAAAQIANGKYFLIGNTLYLSTTTIPAGDTIIPGTNCTKTNLAAALNALNT